MENFKQWTAAQVRQWIRDQRFPTKMEENAIKTIGSMDGKILEAVTSKENLEKHGVDRVFRPVIFRAIEKLRKDSDTNTQNVFEHLMKQQEEKQEKNNVSEFFVMFDASASKLHKSTKKFQSTSTLLELKQYWVDHEKGGAVVDLILIFNSVQYASENNKNQKTLQDIGMTCKNNFVSTLWKTQGGMAQIGNDANPLQRERFANFKHSKIEASLKADCLTGYDERDTQECPSCKTLTKRPDDLTMQRVRCKNAQCSEASDFCWVCGLPWIGGGFRVCGNKNCSTGLINEQLRNSPITKTMWSFVNVEIPTLRACPNCFAKIQHNEHCKHMKCIHCKAEFCFVCLKKKVDGKWQCGDTSGSHTYQCKLAPTQQIK